MVKNVPATEERESFQQIKYFQGNKRKYPFFEGWYFKQQIEKDVYAFIPGYSVGEDGPPEISLYPSHQS